MEMLECVHNVTSCIDKLIHEPKRYKLVLVVGSDDGQRDAVIRELLRQHVYPVLDTGLSLSHELAAIPEARRPLKASSVFKSLIAPNAATSAVVVVDNIGILFDQSLQLDPLGLLEDVSRSTVLVVSWPGTITWNENGTVHALSHAVPEHDEYRIYPHVDTAAIVDIEGEGAK